MLLRLEIENYFSIRDRQVLDFTVAPTAPKQDRFATVFDAETLRVPKVIAFFGANASGKTTALRAISFIRDFVTNSFKEYEPTDDISLFPFDTARDRQRTTKLAIEFVPFTRRELRMLVRYELHVDRKDGQGYVSWEALRIRDAKKKFRNIFERQSDGKKNTIRNSKELPLEQNDPRREVRRNVSLLSSLVQFGHKEAESLINMFRLAFLTNISIGRTKFPEEYVAEYLGKHDFALKHLNRLIRVIDVGIEEVKLIEIDGKNAAVFKHSGLAGLKTFPFESQGTQNFFCLFPNLAYTLRTGSIAVLDEIDSDLHPSLLFEIVRWYWDTAENAADAQLIMSCQHASLLSSLVKEEVFLVEKDDAGATAINGLSKMETLRRDANLYKKYMSGEFGALPRFG